MHVVSCVDSITNILYELVIYFVVLVKFNVELDKILFYTSTICFSFRLEFYPLN